jgi:anti-anti-sigma factor
MTMAPAPSPADVVTIHLDDGLLADGLADVRWLLLGTLHAGARSLVVDLSGVQRLPDAVVGVLLWAHRTCRARGGAVVLCGADRRTADLLRRTGLWRVLVCEPAQAVA